MKTRNFLTRCLLLVSIPFLLAQCNEDEGQPNTNEENEEQALPDGPALLAAYEQNLDEAMQHFTIDAEDGDTLFGNQGTLIIIPPNTLFTQGGDPVTGTVDIELIEFFNKSDMLLANIPTTGKLPNGDRATLISGGEFYVNATKDGVNLLTEGYEIQAPTDEIDGDMAIFNRVEDCDFDTCVMVWEEEDPGQDKGLRVLDGFGADGTGFGYGAFQQNFGWTNIDKWYSDPRPKTTIYAQVPDGYDNTNCNVYIAYSGEPKALARFDVYDSGTELFSEHYGLIPIGLEVHFITIAVVDDEWNYAIHSTTIEEDHVEVVSSLQPISEDDLIDLVDALP